MKKYSKIEGSTGFIRDNTTYAILNTDSEKISQAKIRKLQNKKKIDEIENLKQDVNDIKLMLNQIVDKLNGS